MIKTFKSIREDAPANVAGNPATTNIAGLGTGENEPGVSPGRKRKKLLEYSRGIMRNY